MFGHAHVTTPTCRKYRTLAPPLKFPSYATEYKSPDFLELEAIFNCVIMNL